MNEFIPQADMVASLLLTYLIHSTLVVLLIAGVLRFWKSARADVRVMLWKMALVVPIATSIAVSLLGAPRVGLEFNIASASQSEEINELNVEIANISESADIEFTGDKTHQHLVDDSIDDSENQSVAMSSTAADLPHRPIAPKPAATLGETRQRTEISIPVWSTLVLLSFLCSFAACVGLAVQAMKLRSLRRNSVRVSDTFVRSLLDRLREKAEIRSPIDLMQSDGIQGPMTAGVVRPYILVPSGFFNSLTHEQREALFAHELVHIARRDTLWKLIGHVICRVFFIQPLNRIVRRQLEIESEFVADEQAAQLLDQRSGLAGCLTMLGEWLVTRAATVSDAQPLATGMASFRSTLGRRIETLLADNTASKLTSRFIRTVVGTIVVGVVITIAAFAPRAVAESNKKTASVELEEPMQRQLMLAGLTMPGAAEEEQKKEQPARPQITKKTADKLPDGIARFNGMLVGRVVKKDVEKGTFILNVDAVPRVWRNSKAENPKSIIGKNVEVDGVSGKWLDVLLLVKEGETLQCEARHDGGKRLTFPGELLRKVAQYDPSDYPTLPEGFRGFNGSIAGKIVKKDPEMFELIVRVDRVIDSWKNNRAKNAKSIEGKQMMLAGFWRRKDQFHSLKAGDQIEVGLQHIGQRSDHLTVAEFVRKTKRTSLSSPTSANRENSQGGLPDGINGFMGSLVGQLVEKDVEKGTLVLDVQAVPRVWRNNKARRPKSIIGQTVQIDGISNRLLDVLLTTKKGETLEVAARHDRGDRLTFPGELFRKVAPYKAEDYPVLPDDFRGFMGVITGEIVKKDQSMYGLIVKVNDVSHSFDKSRAKKPESIVGKPAILAGFWRRKEMYANLKVGDRIQAGVQHAVNGTDVLSVVEGVRKVGKDGVPEQDRPKRDLPRSERPRTDAKNDSDSAFPTGMRGFNGVIVGRIVTKDVEKGTFVMNVDAVPRVWRSNAKDPKSIIGKEVFVDGVQGRFLDDLLLCRKGDTLMLLARHNGGDHLTYPGELMRKVDPVKPGDYPELPNEFRGFRGVVLGKIAKKNPNLLELTLEVSKISSTAESSNAKSPESAVGKQLMVGGFWRIRDKYQGLKVGDTVECELKHTQPRSDHVDIGEFRKVNTESK